MNVQQVDASELFNLLESNDLRVAEEIKALIHDNLNSSKEAWLLNGLVDYHNACDSERAREILCGLREPHDKHLFEKLHDCVRILQTRLPSLTLLGHIVTKQPSWLHKIVKDPLFGLLIKTLKHETDAPTLLNGALIICTIMPMIPEGIVPYLESIFDVFSRLANFNTKKPGNMPAVFLLHLNVGVYALFHRLYGMFPCRFIDYLRSHYSKRENSHTFEESIKPLLERMRLHPLLIMSSKEQETNAARWHRLETQDIIIECARMSLDPIEGLHEDFKGGIIRRRFSHQWTSGNSMEQLSNWNSMSNIYPDDSNLQSSMSSLNDQSQVSAHNLSRFWSPSVICGLATPPPSLEGSLLIQSQGVGGVQGPAQTPQTPQTGMTSTPAPSPWETPRDSPPTQEENLERSGQGDTMSNRSSNRSLTYHSRPGSMAAENKPAPLSNVKTISPYVPEYSDAMYSPLKQEFTNKRPFLVQRSDEKCINMPDDLVKPKAIRKIDLSGYGNDGQAIASDQEVKEKPKRGLVSAIGNSGRDTDEKLLSNNQATSTHTKATSIKPKEESHVELTDSEKRLLDKVKSTGVEIKAVDRVETVAAPDLPPLHLQSLPQIIEQFGERHSLDNTDDHEICDINQVTPRSRHESGTSSQSSLLDSFPQTEALTVESVAQFMKNVNRIRFNSMTVHKDANSDIGTVNFSMRTHRAHSCPTFPTGALDIGGPERKIGGTVSPIQEVGSPSKESESTVVDTAVSHAVSELDSLNVYGASHFVASSIPTLPRLTRSDYGNHMACGCAPGCACCTTNVKDQAEDLTQNSYRHLFPHVVPYLPIAQCQKCLDHAFLSPTESRSVVSTEAQTSPQSSITPSSSMAGLGNETPLFTMFSPPEILDRHISLGGAVPSDEINILKGQIHLLHNQLMYERHKRDMHARRNRRLLSKVVKFSTLEEQNAALLDQLRLQEEEINSMKLASKLGHEQLKRLLEDKRINDKQTESQINTLSKEKEDLLYTNGELQKLLVTHKEENDQLQKSLENYKDRVFRLEQDLNVACERVALTDVLKEQNNALTRKVVLQGEIHLRYQEKLRRLQHSHDARPAAENMIKHLKIQLKNVQQSLNEKQVEAESVYAQFSEVNEQLKNRELVIAEQKRELERIKGDHDGDMQSLEDKYRCIKSINQALESNCMLLQEQIQNLLRPPKPGTQVRHSSDISQAEAGQSNPNQISPNKATSSMCASSELPTCKDSHVGPAVVSVSTDNSSATNLVQGQQFRSKDHHESAVASSKPCSLPSSLYQRTDLTQWPGYVIGANNLDSGQNTESVQRCSSAGQISSCVTDNVDLIDSGYGP